MTSEEIERALSEIAESLWETEADEPEMRRTEPSIWERAARPSAARAAVAEAPEATASTVSARCRAVAEICRAEAETSGVVAAWWATESSSWRAEAAMRVLEATTWMPERCTCRTREAKAAAIEPKE